MRKGVFPEISIRDKGCSFFIVWFIETHIKMVGSGSAGGDLRTPQFNGSNYDYWSVKMETILIAYDLWDAVEIGIQPQPIIGQEAGSEGIGDEESEAEQIPVEAPTISREDKIKNAKALSLIQGALTDELFPRIRNEKTAKGAWDILRREYRHYYKK